MGEVRLRSLCFVSPPLMVVSRAVGCLVAPMEFLFIELKSELKSGDGGAVEVSELADACEGRAQNISASSISISKARSERLEHCRSMSPSLSSPKAVSSIVGENMPHICPNTTHEETESPLLRCALRGRTVGGRESGRTMWDEMRGWMKFQVDTRFVSNPS